MYSTHLLGLSDTHWLHKFINRTLNMAVLTVNEAKSISMFAMVTFGPVFNNTILTQIHKTTVLSD